MYKPDNLGYADKFEKIAAELDRTGRQTDPAALRKRFVFLVLPSLRVVDTAGVLDRHPMALAVEAIDRADKPSGQLAAMLEGAGFLVFSNDKSLKRPGLAPPDIATAVASAAAVARGDLAVAGTATVGLVTVQLVDLAVEAVVTRLGASKRAGWALVAGLVVAVHAKRERPTIVLSALTCR